MAVNRPGAASSAGSAMPVPDAVRTRARPTLFFLAAAIHAAVAVPLWIATYADIRSTGLSAPWHAGEMVFGYAYAVFGGFFLTRTSRLFFLTLLAIWLASRILALTPGAPPLTVIVLALTYPFLLFGYAVWPFLRAVRHWRNAVFAPVLATLFIASVLHGLGTMDVVPAGQGRLLAFDLVLVMLFTMGGRFTAAAVSGEVQRLGGRLRRPAQPGLERAGFLCLTAAAVSNLIAPYGSATALFAALAVAVVLMRLWRWQAWRALGRPDVAFLLVGYLWLGAGLGVRAFAGMSYAIPPGEADHVLAVGALGTLSMTVMARVAHQRCGHRLALGYSLIAALSLVSTATVLRFLAAFAEYRDAMVIGAGVCWSAAFILFAFRLAALWRGARQPGNR